MCDVSVGVVAAERTEVVARRDALRELAQLFAREHLVELRLAEQDDTQQFSLVGLEVGEQADLFQHRG